MALVVESLAITAVGVFVCLTFLLRRCIWILTWIVTNRRSCWNATRNNFSRKGCCRELKIMKSCMVESTANLASFLRWARLFVVFVAQAVCTQIALADEVVSITWWAQLIRRASGNVVFLFALLARSFCVKRFIRNVSWSWRLFLLRRKVPMFSTVFRWCVVYWQWEVAFVWLGLYVVRVDKLWGLRTDGSLIAFSTHFVVDLSLEL